METLETRSGTVKILAGCVLLALVPWFTGGNAPIAIMISAFALLTASLIIWNQRDGMTTGDWLLSGLFVGLAGWAALSLIWSVNRYLSVLWLVYLLLAGLAFITTARLVLVPRFRELVLDGYLVIAVIAAGYGVWLYLTGDYSRLTSSFYWANPAAAYFLPAVILCLERGAAAWRYRLAGFIVLTAFLLTDSRGAMLALVISSLIFIAWQKPKKPYWINLVFIVILAFGASLIMGQLRTHLFHQTGAVTPGSRFSQAASGESTSLSDRKNYLTSTYHIWTDHAVLGTGAGTFPAVHPQYQIRVISASTSAHNVYAQTFAELGLVGGVLLLALVVCLIWNSVPAATGRPEAVALVAALIGLLIHFGLDIDSRYPALILLAAVLGGLVYRPGGRQTKLVWPPVVVATLVVVIAISGYESQLWSDRALAAQDDGTYQLAAQDYGRAHSYLFYDPDNITGEGIDWYTLSTQTADTTDARLALMKAQQAEHQDRDDGQQYFLAARAERQLGLDAAAIADYHRALQLDPFDQPIYYADLANLEEKDGQPAAAKATATQAIALYPAAVLANRSADTTLQPTIANLYVIRAIAETHLGQNQASASDDAQAAKLQK